ncbi:hypothetical protein [Campylobacter concisus]|uniref:hypothetical protein n=1 Tax=Campylobacter concisus TaxID=199 RepID=UPI000CD8AFB7|nr:hypothetical protein [Campylobacter concisus]
MIGFDEHFEPFLISLITHFWLKQDRSAGQKNRLVADEALLLNLSANFKNLEVKFSRFGRKFKNVKAVMLKNNRSSQFELLDKHILVRFVAISRKV